MGLDIGIEMGNIDFMKTKVTKVRMSTLIRKALEAGWRHSACGGYTLIRPVPLKTRETYYTQIFRCNCKATEHISINWLRDCGKNSRVWKKLS